MKTDIGCVVVGCNATAIMDDGLDGHGVPMRKRLLLLGGWGATVSVTPEPDSVTIIKFYCPRHNPALKRTGDDECDECADALVADCRPGVAVEKLYEKPCPACGGRFVLISGTAYDTTYRCDHCGDAFTCSPESGPAEITAEEEEKPGVENVVDRIIAQLKETSTTLEIAAELGLHPTPQTAEAEEARERLVAFFVDMVSAAGMIIRDRSDVDFHMASVVDDPVNPDCRVKKSGADVLVDGRVERKPGVIMGPIEHVTDPEKLVETGKPAQPPIADVEEETGFHCPASAGHSTILTDIDLKGHRHDPVAGPMGPPGYCGDEHVHTLHGGEGQTDWAKETPDHTHRARVCRDNRTGPPTLRETPAGPEGLRIAVVRRDRQGRVSVELPPGIELSPDLVDTMHDAWSWARRAELERYCQRQREAREPMQDPVPAHGTVEAGGAGMESSDEARKLLEDLKRRGVDVEALAREVGLVLHLVGRREQVCRRRGQESAEDAAERDPDGEREPSEPEHSDV